MPYEKPSTGALFGAALLNALKEGIEGYGAGQQTEREYALKKLTAAQQIERSRPSLERNVEAYMAMNPSEQAAARELKQPYYAPQLPAQIQVADVVAEIEKIPEEQRTPEQKTKLKQLRKTTKSRLGEVGTTTTTTTQKPFVAPSAKAPEDMTDEELDAALKANKVKGK